MSNLVPAEDDGRVTMGLPSPTRRLAGAVVRRPSDSDAMEFARRLQSDRSLLTHSAPLHSSATFSHRLHTTLRPHLPKSLGNGCYD